MESIKQAFERMKKAALKGDPEAMYDHGHNLGWESADGFEWLHKAADAGWKPALASLG